MAIPTTAGVASPLSISSLPIPLPSSSLRLLQLRPSSSSPASGLHRGQAFAETKSGHGLRSSSSLVWPISTSHVTARAAGGDDALAVQETEGEGEGKGSARTPQSLALVSEADLLRKQAKKARLRRKRLVRKRRLRKKGRWPPSKLAKNKNV